MPRRKRSLSPFDAFDDDFEEDSSSQSSKNGNPPIQRNAANARERARMRVLSSAFGRLKTKLPNIPPDTKLSKLDTLRLATMYIKQLKAIVDGGASNAENNDLTMATTNQAGFFAIQSASQNMTWPFGFHHIQSNSRQHVSQCTPMDWSHSRSSYTKYNRADNVSYQQETNSNQNTNHWFTDEAPLTEAHNTVPNCAFFDPNQHKQNHETHHTRQLYHSTGQATIH